MGARESRAGGKGQTIRYCSFASSLGTITIGATGRGLCALKIGPDRSGLERMLAADSAPAALVGAPLPELKARVLAFIAGEASLARLPLDIRGTVFQRRVWRAL